MNNERLKSESIVLSFPSLALSETLHILDDERLNRNSAEIVQRDISRLLEPWILFCDLAQKGHKHVFQAVHDPSISLNLLEIVCFSVFVQCMGLEDSGDIGETLSSVKEVFVTLCNQEDGHEVDDSAYHNTRKLLLQLKNNTLSTS